MRHAFAIARREVKSYFVSPIAYVAMTIFVFVSGLFFSNMLVYYVTQAGLADREIERTGRSLMQLDVPTIVIGAFFREESSLVLFVLPLLTMSLLTDERRKGTLELLMTSPVRAGEIVAGKFMAGLALVVVMLLPTLVFWAFLAQGGEWEPGVVFAGYLGLLALASTGVAIGLFVSSLCENVLVSAFGTYGLLLTLYFVDTSASAVASIWVKAVNFLSFYVHFANFTRGVVSTVDLVYYATFAAFGLFLTQRSIDAIRFKRS